MTILYLAFGIYIIGVAIVLFIRPNIMFRPGGWKEFGLSSNNSYTVFPFWMFTILWAIISYVLATLCSVMFASVALRSVPENTPVYDVDYGVDDVVAEPIYKPISRARPPKVAAPALPQQPGYYVLEAPTNAAPKYVYYGTSPPSYENVMGHP